MGIRNSAKAVIVTDNKIALIKKQDEEGFFYIFPGGGQDKGETLENAVIRECLEELDAAVQVHELIHVREYIGKNHEFAHFDEDVHQIEFYFMCSIVDESVNGSPIQPDTDQIGIEWIPITDLHSFRVYPNAIVEIIQSTKKTEVYLGDLN
ncbi:NUDIX domain-containing protein [Chryseomicrobium sp. FSL W7-1435]|uniref:NUDIX domain-containing protein n=1 Tax=Chryseomicrobium sp. FSL W7-1435 TaxID=2921704 RepID=UPI00315ABD34